MTKAAWICFDVESKATTNQAIIERITTQVREARPANNTAREIKLLWDEPESVRSRVDAAIAKTAVDPLLAEPLCICASCIEGEVRVLDGMEHSVFDMLLDMVELIQQWCDRDTVWVGHSVENFDLPLLLAQLQKNTITPPDIFPTYRRGKWKGNIFDTMGACPSRTPYISLLDASLAYGLTAKGLEWKGERMTGSRVGEAYDSGEFQLIRDYCKQDVLDETALFMVQSCNGSWGLSPRTDTTAEQLKEIAESFLTPAQKWLAAVPILQSYGLLP
jgi:hypothetical protein